MGEETAAVSVRREWKINMEKILLFQVSEPDKKIIEKISGNMRIKVENISQELYSYKVGELAEGKAGSTAKPDESLNKPLDGSLLVFADVSDKHMDKLLFEIRRQKLSIKHKAVLTPTNKTWNVYQLFFQMELECQKLS